MGRIRIIEPQTYIHTCQLTVRVGDLNYGNHLANDKILAYVQESRILFLRSHGKSEIDFFGTSLIQGDAAVSYLSEGFLGNEISIKLGVLDVSNSSFDFVYSLYNETTQKPLALVKTRMVCFDYETRKVNPVPPSFLDLLN